MKLREGFVSNSSSASFIVSLDKITARQLLRIQQWCGESDWSFHIDLEQGIAEGETSMDNADIAAFLEREGINNNPVKVFGSN